MPDSEKIALIDKMIADYWEFMTEEQKKEGAECLICAIETVISFG